MQNQNVYFIILFCCESEFCVLNRFVERSWKFIWIKYLMWHDIHCIMSTWNECMSSQWSKFMKFCTSHLVQTHSNWSRFENETPGVLSYIFKRYLYAGTTNIVILKTFFNNNIRQRPFMRWLHSWCRRVTRSDRI